ncbi:MAG: type II secretion system F family protein [Candidatus Omnitrophica bacterium]|nr:type II secretion system F family protein [Candidatus Omnitrophota bacterium]
MPTFVYKARDINGRQVKGAMEAQDKTGLVDKLHKMGYMTTTVNETAAGEPPDSIIEKIKQISPSDMLMFYIQFSNMISAGITVLTGLSSLGRQIENRKLKKTIGDVARQVEAGADLSKAFASHPRIFDKLFVSMVAVGEESGKLDTVLMRYADFSERREDLRQKIRGALFYPTLLLFAGIAVTLFIVTSVIPQFAQIYLKAGIKLPALTLVVYKIGTAIKTSWYLFIAAIGILLVGLRYYIKTAGGSLFFDRLKLRAPIVGPLYRKAAMSRFSRTLATLLASGVPILKSLEITKEVVGNEVLGRVIMNVQKGVEKGERMAESLKVSGEFPPDVVQMVSAGEETGNLDGMLNRIADFYDMMVGYAVKKLTTVIEPVFLVIMGGMVGLIMASMLMPIFDMIKILRG